MSSVCRRLHPFVLQSCPSEAKGVKGHPWKTHSKTTCKREPWSISGILPSYIRIITSQRKDPVTNQSAEWNVIMVLNDAQKAMDQMEAIVNIVVVTHWIHVWIIYLHLPIKINHPCIGLRVGNPIPSMGLVYLPTRMVDFFYGFHVGKKTSLHGSDRWVFFSPTFWHPDVTRVLTQPNLLSI